jgi:hypothetical protein
MSPRSLSRDGHRRHTRARGRDGRGAQRDPSGAHARRDPWPRSRHAVLALLRVPFWAPPQSSRRLLARDAGRQRCRTLLYRSPSVLPAHPSGALGTTRAPHRCVARVAQDALSCADAAYTGATCRRQRPGTGRRAQEQALPRTRGIATAATGSCQPADDTPCPADPPATAGRPWGGLWPACGLRTHAVQRFCRPWESGQRASERAR